MKKTTDKLIRYEHPLVTGFSVCRMRIYTGSNSLVTLFTEAEENDEHPSITNSIEYAIDYVNRHDLKDNEKPVCFIENWDDENGTRFSEFEYSNAERKKFRFLALDDFFQIVGEEHRSDFHYLGEGQRKGMNLSALYSNENIH